VATTSVRDPWLDNAKMALVTLVVIGHGWTLLPQTTLSSHVYDFLYAWHIPAFVFVTGYLSRGFAYTPQRFWQLFRTVVVPYLLFECAMATFRVQVGGEKLEDLFADPHWPLWYLSALFFWRLLTPVFRPLWGGVAVALGLSLLAGLWLGDTLDLARVFGLLPFFVLGLKATPESLEPLRATRAKVAGVVILVGIAVLTRFTDRIAATEWLYYRSRYEELDASDLEALVIRLAVLAIGALGAFAFLALVPRVGGWFSRMGAYTLVVYLFHGFVVKGVSYTDFPAWAGDHPDLSLAVTSVGALLLALLLAWRPLASLLQEVVDPFGYAERHARHAVAITAVVTEDEPDGPRMPSGGVSG
jgi:fucose 4-O-acetylase-like acetyltransferase